MPFKSVFKPFSVQADLPVSDVIIRHSVDCYTILLRRFSHELPE